MKAAIYNPYLDTLGGGERYTISFAKVLTDKGYQVDIQWKDKEIKEKIEERFGVILDDINFIKDIKRGDGYDVCFWVSDGSIPLLHARKNFLHFQVPFKDVGGKNLINKMKFFRISKVICNSLFTKKIIDEEYGVESVVIYPPVDVYSIKPIKKENIIINVSRFSQLVQSKRQDILIEAFKRIIKRGLKKWRLVLAGGTEVGSKDFLQMLKKSSRGLPVEIIEKPKFKKLISLYGRSKIFWSASGFGENERKDPSKVEHFGISVVEAMAAGSVPLVFNAGGHKEIVENGKNGFLWKSIEELVKLSLKLVSDRDLFKELSKNAIQRSKIFAYERFKKEVELLL